MQWDKWFFCQHDYFSLAWLASYPHLKWDGVWKPHANFLVFEAWFTNAQSRLLGATNVCQMRLFLAHSQSFQLYLMTYVARQKFYAEEGDRSENV